jgi:hypothetical protein
MIKADSRAYGIEGKTSVYATSAPINSKWGQPSASYYFFTIAGNKMRGQPIAGVYVVSSSVDILAPEPGLSSLDIPDITFEEASNSEWLELSTSAFDFWNNDLDSAYDNL